MNIDIKAEIKINDFKKLVSLKKKMVVKLKFVWIILVNKKVMKILLMTSKSQIKRKMKNDVEYDPDSDN